MTTAHLFVYGSLRTAGTRAGVLVGSRPVGRGMVHGTLFNLGPYPAVRLSDSAGEVVGEVFEIPVSLFATLDQIEGTAAGLFVRTDAAVHLSDGTVISAVLYEAGPLLGRALLSAPVISSGDWFV